MLNKRKQSKAKQSKAQVLRTLQVSNRIMSGYCYRFPMRYADMLEKQCQVLDYSIDYFEPPGIDKHGLSYRG